VFLVECPSRVKNSEVELAGVDFRFTPSHEVTAVDSFNLAGGTKGAWAPIWTLSFSASPSKYAALVSTTIKATSPMSLISA
jgi:hypothetical protein